MNATAFRCGHPRQPGNVSYGRCALCERVRNICRQHRIDQQRINLGTYTLGQKIAKGML